LGSLDDRLLGERNVDQPAEHRLQGWHIAPIAIAMVGMWAFLEDIIKADWVAWLMPPLFVLSFFGLLWAFRRTSFARDALWFLALLILAFVGIYDVLDLILDPLIRSDMLIAAAALVVLAGIWSSLSAVLAVEEG